MGSKRIKWLDFAKGIAILVVVMCHSGFQSGANSPLFQIFENFLLIFAMPLFFAISGFLYKPSDNLRKFKILLYKKSASFIFPYLLFTIITILLGMVSNRNIMSNFYRVYAMPVEYLWFLYSLFIIFLIFGVMSLFHFKWYLQLFISVVLMISQIYLPWQYIKGDINPLSGIGSYMICFYTGHLMKRFHIVKKLRSSKFFIVLPIVWIILIGIEFWITGVSYNTDLFNYPDIITKLLSIPVLFALFSKISKHEWHKWFFRYFDKYGRYTLIIYLVHLPLIFVAGKLFSKHPIISNHKLLFIIYVIVGWVGSILICYVTRKLKWIGYVFYPRQYLDNTKLNPNDDVIDKFLRQMDREKGIHNFVDKSRILLFKGGLIIPSLIFVFLILPFLLRRCCSYKYLNYWGNYYSNAITILGVFITIYYENRESEKRYIDNIYSKYDIHMNNINLKVAHIQRVSLWIAEIFRRDPKQGYMIFVNNTNRLNDFIKYIYEFNKDISVLKDIFNINLAHNPSRIFFFYEKRCKTFLAMSNDLLNVNNIQIKNYKYMDNICSNLSYASERYFTAASNLFNMLSHKKGILLNKVKKYNR